MWRFESLSRAPGSRSLTAVWSSSQQPQALWHAPLLLLDLSDPLHWLQQKLI
jgi:hypothetical protein